MKNFGKFLEIAYGTKDKQNIVQEYIAAFQFREAAKGRIECCKFFKNLYSVFQRFAADQSFDRIPYTRCDSDGIPLGYQSLKKMAMGSENERRSALCILQLYKLVETDNPDYSLKSVIEAGPIPWYDTPSLDKNLSYLERVITLKFGKIDGLNLKIVQSYKDTIKYHFREDSKAKRIRDISNLSNLHQSTKNGPNGPCLSTILPDWESLKGTPILENIKAISSLTRNSSLNGMIKEFEQDDAELTSEKGKTPIHSKLSVKQEVGAKTRIFAIGDWFTQSSLSGIHKWLFNWLKLQVEDGTHSHNYVSQIARSWTIESSGEINSIDLTTATDRIPQQMYGEILSEIAGEDFARHWVNLMTNRDFVAPNGELVRYNKGQPMGFLSSWAMLAVWHHMICRTCMHVLQIPRDPATANYLVIGDDVALRGKEFGKLYHYIVEELLEVPISKLKGFSPELTLNRNRLESNVPMITCEIAKRVFANGVELTPVSPVLIREGLESPSDFPSLLAEMENRSSSNDWMEPLPALSNLCFKPKLALLFATFPLAPRPTRGVREFIIGNVSDRNSYLLQTKWYTNWSTERFYLIRSLFKSKLVERAESAYNTTYVRITDLICEAQSGKSCKVAHWLYKSSAQLYLWEILGNDAYFSLNEEVGLYDESIAQDVSDSLDTGDLKSLVNRLLSLYDLDLLFRDEGSRFRDRKQVLSRIYSDIAKEIADLPEGVL